MAYNLESLVKILDQILQPDQQLWIIPDDKRPQIESLLEKASSLKQILETSSLASGRRIESLESQIRDASHKAEDIIESHMVDQMLSMPEGKSFTISPPDMQQVIEELDSARDKLKKIMDENIQMVNTPLPGSVPLTPGPSSQEVVVGLDEDILHLKDQLTRDQSKLEIIPIVGMGGIGKTTLARNLYNDKYIISHFDTFAWTRISQDYNVRAILLDLLSCIMGKPTDELLQKNDSHLALVLYQCLSGRRYLIILDDMWSTSAWDDIKMFFPKDNNGSRIILTTRESHVANYVESSSPQHQMHLLSTFESWKLLQQKVFGKDNCPPELESIGANIARSCGGLPLAIHVIGGLLYKGKRTTDFWDHVAADIKAAISENDEQVFNVLSLSYNHLPNHLKPCFLYLGTLTEDFRIRASYLILLLAAEGFLKSNGDKSLEERAEDYLKALADRNLIVVVDHKSNGKPKTYDIHDLLRELCIRKAYQERFLYIPNQQVHNVLEDSPYALRRVSVNPSCCIYAAEEFMLLARSFLCTGYLSHTILSPAYSKLRLLRVLDVYRTEFQQFPTEILQLVNLRFLAFSCHSDLPSAISRLWNLQTLIVGLKLGGSRLPPEILEMPELKHIFFTGRTVHIDHYYRKDFVQEKLQKIFNMHLDQLLQSNILGCIPNIRYLGVCFRSSQTNVIDLYHLHKLETFKCGSDLSLNTTFLSTLRFPPSLRKLNLWRCKIPWEFMTTVASLTNLEVLKIRECAFEGEQEWETADEEFCSLRFLLLEGLNLVQWRANETNFPRLRHLVIRNCCALKEIPADIGLVPTLELIEVDKLSPSVVDSVGQIKAKQQEYFGADDVEIHIN